MDTQILQPTDEAIQTAARVLREGGLVGMPTETVYGLGANALDDAAVRAIFAAKGRPADNPLIVHVPSPESVAPLCHISEAARALMERFCPGPLTLLMPKKPCIPAVVNAGLPSVAVRIPSHPVAQRLLQACGVPVAAPSANLSGKPSPTTAAHVLADMDGRVPMIIDGGACDVGLESTVVDVRSTPVRVLRPGGVTPRMIADVLGEVEVDGSVLRPLKQGEIVRSPGMKYKHYAPDGSLVIVKGSAEKVAREICALYDESDGEKRILALEAHIPLYGNRRVFSLGADAKSMANRLFDALREMDAERVNAIFSEAVPAEDIGLAVMNRLGRAAAFHIVDAGEDE